MQNLDVDQGTAFGTWPDPVSRYMYHGVMEALGKSKFLDMLTGHVGDFGGANGLLKQYISNKVTTIDQDESKQPDIVDNILFHTDYYETAFTRYVAHYLSDKELLMFLRNVNADKLFMLEFTNEGGDLRSKYKNSIGEVKHFRTQSQLMALLPAGTRCLTSFTYTVDSAFYENRLGISGAVPHTETVGFYQVPLV